VGELELVTTGDRDRLRLRTIVVDRDYHRRLLHGLTGLVAGDRQAALMVNEIKQLQATLAKQQNRTVGLQAAAFRWLEKLYRPTTEKLREKIGTEEPDTELYCQLLEHKWYLSERAKRDVGHEAALADYLASHSRPPP
jgi:Domain of unknown function (DUF4032)